MTPEVEDRIRQISNGEIPKGYKMGKLGIVPEDWEEVQFSTLFTSTSDYTDDLEKYPLYSLTIENGVTAKTERYERSHLVKKENSYKIVRPNDFAYNPMNIRFGAVARHKGEQPVAVSGYYDIFTTVNSSDLAFFESFLTCDSIITYYNKMSTGSLIEKQRVHFSDFLEFQLPLPSAQERQKIADIVCAQNHVIEAKEKLLQEKQNNKKYVMQQLFCRSKRVKRYTEKWEEISFDKIFSFHSSNTFSREYMVSTGGEIFNIHYGDILVEYGEILDTQVQQIPQLTAEICEKASDYIKDGDIIIADTAEDYTAGKAIEVQNVGETKIVSGLHTIFCRPQSGLFAPGWLGYYMNSECYHNQLRRYIAGVKVMSISKGNIVNTTIAVPSIEEQKRIVDVLTTIDQEIKLLKASIEQEKQKKKALMQLLLTGMVRV